MRQGRFPSNASETRGSRESNDTRLEWLEGESAFFLPYADKLLVVVLCSDDVDTSELEAFVGDHGLNAPVFALRRPNTRDRERARAGAPKRCLLVFDCPVRPSKKDGIRIGIRGGDVVAEPVALRPTTPFQLRRLIESFGVGADLEAFVGRLSRIRPETSSATPTHGATSAIVVESLDGSVIRGHAFHDGIARPLGIEIFVGDIHVGDTATSRRRDDLEAQRGRSVPIGFEFDFHHVVLPRELRPDGTQALSLRVRPSGSETAPTSALEIPRERYLGWVKEQANEVAGRVDVRRERVADLIDAEPHPTARPDVDVIAFYLPQFHPIAENDAWWGDGFTEWSNVTRTRPMFEGHHQPQLPADLGYYDLRVPEVRRQQIRLAREHGVGGFCFYYYWFGGRRLLERPLDEYVADQTVDFPFCICWANENWSRRWDGSDSELLIGQAHSVVEDQRFIHDVIPLLKDPRYIRVRGAPLLLVYRVPLLENPKVTASRWREICREQGVGEVHLAMVETFGSTDPTEFDFDSSVQFPPHSIPARPVEVEGLDPEFDGNIYDYRDVVVNELRALPTSHSRFRGVMLGWDNSARRGPKANIYHHASPGLYEAWLRSAIHATRRDQPVGSRYVFVNAWNEWAEGTHLEPDTRYGRAYLQATRRAVHDDSGWSTLLEQGRGLAGDDGELREVFDAIAARFRGYERSLEILQHAPMSLPVPVTRLAFTASLPETLDAVRAARRGQGQVDSANGFPHLDGLVVERSGVLDLSGRWSVPTAEASDAVPTFVAIRSVDESRTYYVPIMNRSAGSSSRAALTFEEGAASFSFVVSATLGGVEPGRYKAFGVFRGAREHVTYWTQFHGIFEVVVR